ncbi:MAG: hypothetical protein J5695_06575 [Bacteroidales bacterium]|nr:hypothetical protein [Bacteroidales bacterium]
MRTRNTKYPPFLAMLMMAFALVGCSECEGIDTFNNIVAQNSPQAIDESGTATLRFFVYWNEKTYERPITDMTVTFTATNGSCTASAQTDANGEVVCIFKTPDPYNFDGGSVKASAKAINHNTESGDVELGGYVTAEAVVLPLLRPSKSKVKPKIKVIDEPVTGEDGKTRFVVKLTEGEEGGVTEDPLPGREVRFETDPEKGTVTEKAITDEKGEAGAEFEPKDPENFEGVDVTAKATVKYSDGEVDVETKVPIQKPVETGFRLTAQESPQKAQRLGNDCVFLLEKLTDGVPEPLANAKVTFTAENGKIDASFQEGTTNSDGLVRTFYRVQDLLTFDGGKVTASATVEDNSVQGFIDVEPADIGLKFDWQPDHQAPGYSDGEASYMLSIQYTVQEQGQEVMLQYASEGDVSIETGGEGEIISPEGASSFHFSNNMSIKYRMDKQKYANTYPYNYPGDKITVKVQSLKEMPKLPESGTVGEAIVDRFSPALVISSSSPNKVDDNNRCTVKFSFKDNLTGNPLKVKAQFEAEGGKCTEEAESDDKGEIDCFFEMDVKSLLVGGKITCTVTELAYTGGGLMTIMPITHQATVDPLDLTYKIEPLQAEYGYDPNGEATVTFQLSGKEEATGVTWTELPGRVIRFQTTNGSTNASGDWMTTDANGQVSVVFKGKDATANGIIKAYHEYHNENGGVVYAYSPEVPVVPMDYTIVCTNSPQMADQSGSASLIYQLTGVNGHDGKTYNNVPGRVIYLTPSNGSCPPDVTTNNDSKATIAFQLTDLKVQGSAEALFKYKVNGAEKQLAAVGIVEPYDEIKDEALKKANKLKDNVYVIEKDGAKKEVTVDDLPDGEGPRDYIVYGAKKDNGETKVLFLEFCKEHPVHYTVGGGTIHIRPDQIGKEIDMLKEDPNGLCWMNLFSLQDVNQGYSETNPETSFSAPGNPDIVEAKCKFTQNSDGSLTGLAYFKKKDGTEGYFKMKATRKANWSD